jgi:hypothetical protein
MNRPVAMFDCGCSAELRPSNKEPNATLTLCALHGAAPDLLAAVMPVLSFSLDTMPAEWLSQLTQRIRAAILKADPVREVPAKTPTAAEWAEHTHQQGAGCRPDGEGC